MSETSFTLTRQSDGLIYRFSAEGRRNDRLAYRRSDADLWITWDPQWGWCAKAEDGAIAGLSLAVAPPDQGVQPPEGPWVSRKGPKSYVYDLDWPQPEARI